MKFFLKRVLQLSTVFALGFGCVKIYDIYNEQKNSRYPAKKIDIINEKPFVVVIVGRDNNPFIEKSIHSVVSQNYKNFRIIYLSNESANQRILEIQENFGRERFLIVHNDDDFVSFESMHKAIQNCADHEIVVLLDGVDFISHEKVLNKLNKIYSTSPTWLTYGNYLDYPSYKQKNQNNKPIAKRVIFNNSFRKQEISSSYFNSFYAGLFKQIRKEDLCYKGGFLPASNPIAIIIPMLEMSGKHSRFIGEIMYLRNTAVSSESEESLTIQEHIKSLPKYKRVQNLSFETN
ncbi:MAG: glycosyltransferase family 2 protein [Chlamydiae bacterium]|nr:glycosyltransferase family 2 protein [Chlamydiota bacterium]